MRINQVGRYTILAELAQGGMGTVYLGVARGLAGFSKIMVIKLLRPELADDPTFLSMFLEEARLAARLNHPNVVQTTEVGSEGNLHFLAMEYLDGQSLQRVRTRTGRGGDLPLDVHLKIIAETLHGLHYAHELKDLSGAPLHIVHRDVSPHNVFVTYDGQVKVVDFGIAKAVDSSLETRTGEIKGKVAYMPPEQAMMKKVDRRADVFAVGVMLWEALAHRRIWQGMNEMAIMHALVTGAIPPLASVRPDVDPELAAIAERALAPDPEGRFATAEEMAFALEAALGRRGAQPSMRDIGRVVAEAFAADREELGRIVGAQLRKLEEQPDASPSQPGRPLQLEPIDLSRMNLTPSIALAPMEQSRSGATQSAFGPAPSAAPMAPAPQAPPKPFPTGLVLGGLGAVVLLAAGIFAAALLHKPDAVAAAPQPTAPTASATPTSAGGSTNASDRVTLRLSAQPDGARFTVDGTPVDGNPYVGPYKKDGLTHQIKVDAPGYDPQRFAVVFDQDVARDVALKKHVAGAAPPPATAPTAKASAADSADGPVRKPNREIDTSFYGK